MAGKQRVSVSAKTPKSKARKDSGATATGQKWAATPEAESKALKLRVVAGVLWALAIALEVFTIVWALVPDKEFDNARMWTVIGLIVGIGVLTVIGSLLWKKANKLDPASEEDKVRFFVQNQLGVIITVLAFLPLIVFVLMDKNLDGKQKGILGGVAAVVAVVVGIASADFDPPSVEKYTEDQNVITLLHDGDADAPVYWTKSGKVYHVCDKVSAVNQESADNTIYDGTIDAAQEAGKERLTKQWKSEARTCGFAEDDITRVEQGLKSNPSRLIEPSASESETVGVG
ncbi:hypothetical protein L5G32_11395 [Gordonia sp. HY002]|uniref:hypothetical protein n=1 Tax=Gordonia zhenghanii TaxID=2911516 RepID=UPI001EF04A53|nr:hypothetical protein [Gordonia zhenghanii]MCF8570871.1 hypothetical protein [Gordonia zhenghanii]MCF8608355.1 hypothetical protein [Gordonia zhenghanii]